MNVIDSIPAEFVEENDLVRFEVQLSDDDEPFTETLRVVEIEDDGTVVTIRGDSLVTGDSEHYSFVPERLIDILGA